MYLGGKMNKEEIENLIREKEQELKTITKRITDEINALKLELQKYCDEEQNINYSREERAEIFASYFRGRDDVYPYLSIDKKDSSKKYYIPACMNEWKKGVCNKTIGKSCKTCQYRENKPITLDIIYNSQTYDKITDLSTGLYFQSSGYNYDILKHELTYGKVG